MNAVMKLPIVAAKVTNADTATASLVTNPKKTMQNGVTIAPPPTPAIVDKTLIPIIAKMPQISKLICGNTSLWSHSPSTQTLKSFWQSSLIVHFYFDAAVTSAANAATVRSLFILLIRFLSN